VIPIDGGMSAGVKPPSMMGRPTGARAGSPAAPR
jgi:hypothetical protein